MSNKRNIIKIKKPNHKLRMAIKILILILIIVIVIFSIYLRLSDKPKSETIKPNFDSVKKNSEEYLKDKVIPQHIYDFSVEYDGEIERNEIYEKLYDISRFLPELCLDLKNTDVKEYYSNSSNKIKKYLGIQTEDEFIKFNEFLEENDVSNLDFKYCEYYSGSLVKDQDYSNFQIDFCYDNNKILTFNMGIVNKYVYNKPIIKINI